jgi:hypothetical protein
MKHFDTEDVVLLVAVLISAISTLVDELFGSALFKTLKILALLFTLWLAIQRIRHSRPFFRDIQPTDWKEAGNEFEFRIPRSEHGRGKFPFSRCLVKNEHGEFAECFVDALVANTGEISVRVNSRVPIRVEVRK